MDPNTIRPIRDKILVRRHRAPDTTEGGLALPSSAIKMPNTCDVVAVGPGAVQKDGTIRPLSVKAGDVIVMGPHKGIPVSGEGKSEDLYLMIREGDIGAVRN